MLKEGKKLTFHKFSCAKIGHAHEEKEVLKGSIFTKILKKYISKRSPELLAIFGGIFDVETRLMMARWKALSVYFLKMFISLPTDH